MRNEGVWKQKHSGIIGRAGDRVIIRDHFGRLCGADTVLPVETLNPPSGVYQLLFSGKERMAIRAYLYLHIADSREGFKRIATGTGNG